MSFSTLTKLKDISAKNTEESVKIKQLKQELTLFKRLYFELLNKNQEEGDSTE